MNLRILNVIDKPRTTTFLMRRNQKNIFYAYNLGDAIRDGYVKDPWVGTEADVDFSQWKEDSIDTDARKLQLAAYFHERAKVALKEYALENNKVPFFFPNLNKCC